VFDLHVSVDQTSAFKALVQSKVSFNGTAENKMSIHKSADIEHFIRFRTFSDSTRAATYKQIE